MSAPDIQRHADDLTRLLERFDADVEALGERVRAEVVVPICKKYRLVFTSGMGMFTFQRRDVKSVIGVGERDPIYGNVKDLDVDYLPTVGLSKWAKEALRPVLELLNEDVAGDLSLGHFVSDVDLY